MDRIGLFIVFSFILVALTGHAVEGPDDCGAKLVGRDRYFGAVKARVKAGLLGPAELEKIVASDRPIHPLKTETPLSGNTSAIRLFDTLIEDPEVQAQWKNTREAIRGLLLAELDAARARAHATTETGTVLAPRMHYRLEGISGGFALGELPDHRPVVAVVHSGFLRVIDLDSKTEFAKLPAPKFLESLKPVWHRDLDGNVWIYIWGRGVEVPGVFVFRAKLGEDKGFKLLEAPKSDNRLNPFELKEVRSWIPGKIGATVARRNEFDRYFLLDSGRFVEVSPESIFNNLAGAPPPKGKNVAPRRGLPDILYQTQSGQLVVVFGGFETKLFATSVQSGTTTLELSLRNSSTPSAFAFGEANEQIYLAALFTNRIKIFEPFASDVAVVDLPITPLGFGHGHWFISPEGRLLYGCLTSNGKPLATIVDVAAKSKIDFPVPERIEDWLSVSNQTYFALENDHGLEVFSLFNKP